MRVREFAQRCFPMILQPRDIDVLAYLGRYFILNSRQIREYCFADDTTGRITRRRMSKLAGAGYVRKRNMQVVNPADGSATPVYHLAKQGREFLAGHFDDEALLYKPVEPSQPQHLYHYVAVSETHRLVEQAESLHADIAVPKWINEDECVNPEEPDRHKRMQLRSSYDQPSKVVCLPDAAFMIDYQQHKLAVYVEQDRDTFFHDRVAARKSPGYRQMSLMHGHRKHFPDSTIDFFYVLVITPTARRAEQLRNSFAKKNKDDAQKIYRFGSVEELTAQNIFFEPMFSCCHHGDKVPLVKRTD